MQICLQLTAYSSLPFLQTVRKRWSKSLTSKSLTRSPPSTRQLRQNTPVGSQILIASFTKRIALAASIRVFCHAHSCSVRPIKAPSPLHANPDTVVTHLFLILVIFVRTWQTRGHRRGHVWHDQVDAPGRAGTSRVCWIVASLQRTCHEVVLSRNAQAG